MSDAHPDAQAQPPAEVSRVGWQPLVPFPATAADGPGSDREASAHGPAIELLGCLERRGEALRLRFRLQVDLEALILPPAAAEPARRDGLWQHTCLEAFWGVPGEPVYWELNASPSGDWNLYRFERYREGLQPEPLPVPPSAHWTLTPAAAEQPAQLELDLHCAAPAGLSAGDLEASLTAVLEHPDGRLSYWALHHPGAEPDFHHRQGFRLRL